MSKPEPTRAAPPPPDLEPELARELGKAALSAGKIDVAIQHLRRAARESADARLRAEAANALGSALFLAHQPEEAMADLTEVIDALPYERWRLWLPRAEEELMAAYLLVDLDIHDQGSIHAGIVPADHNSHAH